MDTTADPFRHQLTADLLRHAVSRAIFNQDDQNVADVRRSVYVELQDGTLGVVSGAAFDRLEGPTNPTVKAYLDGRILYTKSGGVSKSAAAKAHTGAYWSAQ